MVENNPIGQKTRWEKEKLLARCNFSFSHSVFKRFVLQTHKNKGLFGKVLNIFFQSIAEIYSNIYSTDYSRATSQHYFKSTMFWCQELAVCAF